MASNDRRESGEELIFNYARIRGVEDGRALELSISNAEDEEETVKCLQRSLKVCAEDKNDLKKKKRLEEDLLAQDGTAKAIALQVTSRRGILH